MIISLFLLTLGFQEAEQVDELKCERSSYSKGVLDGAETLQKKSQKSVQGALKNCDPSKAVVVTTENVDGLNITYLVCCIRRE